MIRSIFLYFCFVIFMIGSIYKKIKLNYLKKHVSAESAQAYLYKCVKGWGDFVLNFIGVNVNVIGFENVPKENCLFVSNHQGSIDIPLLVAKIGKTAGFVAKKEMLKFRFMSSWAKEIHCVFMDRSNIRESVKSINEGIECLKKGYSLIIFPEGTRSKGPDLGEFKKGSMKLGTKSGVPIVPVTIDGSYAARDINKFNILKPCKVTLTFSKPIYPSQLSREEQGNLSETVKGIIAQNLKNNLK